MKKTYIGRIEEKIIFVQLPKVKDPIATGLDTDSDIVGCFLSGWNTLASAKSLLQYLDIIKNKDDSHEEYEELERFGISSEFEDDRLVFVDSGVTIRSGLRETDIVSLDTFILIVEYWNKYLSIAKNKDVVFYCGRLFYDIEIKNITPKV